MYSIFLVNSSSKKAYLEPIINIKNRAGLFAELFVTDMELFIEINDICVYSKELRKKFFSSEYVTNYPAAFDDGYIRIYDQEDGIMHDIVTSKDDMQKLIDDLANEFFDVYIKEIIEDYSKTLPTEKFMWETDIEY